MTPEARSVDGPRALATGSTGFFSIGGGSLANSTSGAGLPNRIRQVGQLPSIQPDFGVAHTGHRSASLLIKRVSISSSRNPSRCYSFSFRPICEGFHAVTLYAFMLHSAPHWLSTVSK